MAVSQITEITDLDVLNKAVGETSLAAEPTNKTVSLAEAIGHHCLIRINRVYWQPELPLREILEQQETRAQLNGAPEPLYIIPLQVETNHGAFDKVGGVHTVGLTHIGCFGLVWESNLEATFPSMVRFSKWRNMFTNIFEAQPDFKKMTDDRVGPIFQLTADRNPALVDAIFAMCVRDLLQHSYGPLRI